MSHTDDIQFLIIPKIKRFSGPLFFTRSLEKAGGNIVNNGSFGLIDTGEKKLLVTCSHVLAGFRTELAEDGAMKLCACLDRKNPVVLSLENLIDEDKGADLATFDMEPMLSVCEGRSFFRIYCEHIFPVKKGDRLVFVGYPGRHRTETDHGIVFGTTPHVMIAQDVNHGLVARTTDMMTMDRHLVAEQHENPYGGTSGSPCFVMKNYTSVELVGFVAGDLKMQQLMHFASARHLNSDGTIKK